MCGICGVFAVDGKLDPDIRAALPAMTDALRHRGPDAEGSFVDDVAGLGHRRLSIIDVATGDQPIANEDRTCWIVFNGEIYNHRDVRADLLSRGHHFRTASDTEAILHAYEEYGTSCVERLEGMFAFAIYDARRREVFLARDRLGKKPLFYALLQGVLHFGSEMKCFYASPAWNDALDLSSIEGYLSLGYFLAPHTVYRHVRKLEPGHWLRLSNGRLEERQYWDVREFGTDRRSEREVLGDLELLLSAAVRDRLESEVPLGAFLSGGIDSGLVVSFMAGAAARVVTASVGFANDAQNELEAAGLTAGHFHTCHHPHVIDPRLEDLLEPIVAAFDEPFADASAIPTWYVSKAAREHVTVALSGDGGDETFAGYDFRYVPHALEARARRLVRGSIGRSLAAGLARVWPQRSWLPRPLRLSTVFENLSRDAADSYYLDLCFLKPGRTRWLLGSAALNDPRDSPVYEAVTAPYRRCTSDSAVQKAQYADLKVYMPNDPLVKVDRMSMQHALEVRCPFLDRRVVEFAFRLPTETKMAKLRGKHLLRVLAARRLPTRVSQLPKLGFNAPVSQWLAGPYRDLIAEDLFSSTARVSSIMDPRRLRQLHSEHALGQRDWWYPLWAAWVFERWARRQAAIGKGRNGASAG
jgi:asparagine synthase (glutamine-hydrolysing)